VNRIVVNISKIDLIRYIRISEDNIQASNEIKIKGRLKLPVSTPDHPSAVGIHLILDFVTNAVLFFEITSAVKGYGEKMVRAVAAALPDGWEAAVIMDWSNGFWEKMANKYDRISFL